MLTTFHVELRVSGNTKRTANETGYAEVKAAGEGHRGGYHGFRWYLQVNPDQGRGYVRKTWVEGYAPMIVKING